MPDFQYLVNKLSSKELSEMKFHAHAYPAQGGTGHTPVNRQGISLSV
jgi:hypothetical protein